jgi:N-acetylmuramoyl-L-alanine amidase
MGSSPRRSGWRSSIWLIVAAALGLAACGSSHGASAPTSTAPTSTAPTATTGSPSSATVAATPTTATTPTTAAPATTAAQPLGGKVVVIDPGHNGGNFEATAEINQQVNVLTEEKACDTTGAVASDGYTEASFNFDVALRTQALLEAEGANVFLTRTSNTGVGPCVTVRAAIGNEDHANVAISIHADGGPVDGRGFQILQPGAIPDGYNNSILAPSHQLALDLQATFPAATGMPPSTYYGVNGLATRTDLGGLNLSLVPKVFVECGNLQNAADLALLQSPAWRQLAAQGLANGITRFLTSN